MRRALLIVPALFLALVPPAGAQAITPTPSPVGPTAPSPTPDPTAPTPADPSINPQPTAAPPGTAAALQPQISRSVITSVSDWQRGARQDGLQIINNADGELRLADGVTQGVYESQVVSTTFAINAVAALWSADVPPGTTLRLEVRAGPAADQLGDYRALAGGDARPQDAGDVTALEAPLPVAPSSAYIQLRATFAATVQNASPLLSDVTLVGIGTPAGPGLAGIPAVPARFGPATLTPPPAVIERARWSGQTPPVTRAARQTPRGIILHQIGADGLDAPLPYLRAMLSYQTDVLGWEDTPFHFIVDGAGNIFEGRAGGPTASAPRLSGGSPAIHVALIGTAAPPGPQLAAAEGLLAWLGQAYTIPPLGQHPTAVAGATVVLPNIAGHAEVVPEATDPSPQLRELLPELRRRVDQTTVRSRWYFAEGNVFDFAQRLAVLNPTDDIASVRFILLRQPGPTVVREASVASGGRVDLVVNSVFSDTTDVPSIIESNAAIVAERFMTFGNDLTATPGVSQPSRVWYFAEGSTEGTNRTFLVLFNPQSVEVRADITYIKSDGTTATEAEGIRIPPFTRRVVIVGDRLSGAAFGTRIIATQPIVAERTMIFGPNATATTGGVHTSPGVTQLSRRWFFAEGTTQRPFQMSIMVLNPNAQPTNVAVTFLTQDGTSLTRRYAVPEVSRLAINVNEVVPELGVATTVEADRPIAAERVLTWRNGVAGTAAPGAAAPAFSWRFADGRTSGDFQEYLLLSNPNRNQARVTVEFVLANGSRATQTVVMPGSSRYTMPVHEIYPGQQAISATVRSTQPIVAERSLFQGPPGADTNRGGATTLGVPE